MNQISRQTSNAFGCWEKPPERQQVSSILESNMVQAAKSHGPHSCAGEVVCIEEQLMTTMVAHHTLTLTFRLIVHLHLTVAAGPLFRSRASRWPQVNFNEHTHLNIDGWHFLAQEDRLCCCERSLGEGLRDRVLRLARSAGRRRPLRGANVMSEREPLCELRSFGLKIPDAEFLKPVFQCRMCFRMPRFYQAQDPATPESQFKAQLKLV